jgi:hypothetical protein
METLAAWLEGGDRAAFLRRTAIFEWGAVFS